jgi:uncharacterized membrane protein YoaK (UPF0700 family)
VEEIGCKHPRALNYKETAINCNMNSSMVNRDNERQYLAENGDSERQPLLSTASRSRTSLNEFHGFMTSDISTTYGDIALLAFYVVTGLLDSSSISIWNTFVSMLTGNTVYFGLGLTNPSQGTRWIKAGISIVSFCAGSFSFSRYQNIAPRKRWVIASSYLFQTVLIGLAAVIVMIDSRTSPINDLRWQVLIPISLVAFQAAGQAVLSRALKFNALTSVVLTSIYLDLFSDVELFAGVTHNVPRNQRVTAPIAMLIGVVGGGLWAKSAIGMAGALWTAVMLKLLIIGGALMVPT